MFIDNSRKSIEKIELNKKLTDEFPFLLPRNVFTDELPDNYDYSYTLLDEMPSGWKKSFGLKMCNELKKVLIETNCLDTFRIHQIKEKYGTLRIYSNFTNDKLEKVISKYEDLSASTCLYCGQPAEYVTLGWISYLCEKCAKESHYYATFKRGYSKLQ